MPLTLIHSKLILSPHSLTFDTMAAFQFPDPAVQDLVQNPITGSTYKWKADPGKWVIVAQSTSSSDFIWEGPNPPLLAPGDDNDYKLWYNTGTLELYFYYCDINGVCAWVPTAVPIQVLEDLNAFAAQAEVDIDQLQYKQQLLQNALDQIYLEQQQQLGNFVEKAGDVMTGDLKFDAADIVFQPIVADGDSDGARPERWNSLVSKRVRDDNGNVISGSNDFGIRIDLTEGRTGYNKFEFFANVDGTTTGEKFADFGGGNNPTFRFKRGSFQMEGNRIQKLGNAEVDTDAISLGQVKDELKDFKSEIIEQAAVGVFKWDTQSSNTTPNTGCFFGKNDANNATEPFINNFRVSNEDINGANQDFSTWEVGDIITWTNTINSAYQIRYRVNSVPTFQNGHYFFQVTYISQSNLFVQGNDFILTRQQFTNIDFGDLETTYLRLDASNSPIVSTPGLEIKTDVEQGGGFGEASLILNGKRDNANNSCAAIKFKNWNYDDTDDINGYITYRSNDTKHFFRFNKDIDLISDVNLSFSNGGAIQHNGGDRIIFDAASNGNEGSGLVTFTRPGNTARRGVVIKGKYEDDDGNTVSDGDLFFTYTNDDVDAINYVGKISGKKNLVNKGYIDDKFDFSKYNELS